MLKKLHFKSWLLMLVMLLGVTNAWADTSKLTFTAACGGSGTADDGAEWVVSSDAAESTYDNTKGIHYGTGKVAVSYLNLTTSAISGTITQIKVNASGASGTTAKLNITVGGSAFGSEQSITSSATDYTLTGSATGEIKVAITQASATKALYCKSIEVTYTPAGAASTTVTIDATGITNTDVYTSKEAGSLSASVTSDGSAVSGATVTWSGDNNAVATINQNTGAVTLVAAGSVTFTASYAGVSGTYASSSATYEMTVTDTTPFAGGDVTFDATSDTGTSPLTKNGVTFTCSNGALNNGSEYRLYKSSTTTFSTSEGVITSIAFTGVSGNPASGFASQTGWTTDGDNGTWTGSANSVSFTASGAQVRASKIVVTVDLNATPDPVISADNVNIEYNTTSSSITFTVNNPVDGGVVTAESSESWLTVGTPSNGSVALTCSENSETTVRTATVTLTYTYNTNETVTKDVTVTQAAAPVSYTTIPDIFNAATSTATDVYVTFNNWVVSGVSANGKNVFVTDGTNGFVIYSSSDQSDTYAVGNILSGTAVSCSLKLYCGYAQITSLDASVLTITSGGTISPANVAMENLAGVNTGALVSYENLTCSVDDSGNTTKYYLSDGTTTIQVYNSIFAFDALESGKTYNITGVYQQYNSTKEILPRSAADIEEISALKRGDVNGDGEVNIADVTTLVNIILGKE